MAAFREPAGAAPPSRDRPSTKTASDAGETKPRPFIDDVDFQLYVGDVRDVLAQLPDESVHCCVTSPPYWGLRDYGTGSWEGGDAACDHLQVVGKVGKSSTLRSDGRAHTGPYEGEKATETPYPFHDACGKCGARRVDRQLGLEIPTKCSYFYDADAIREPAAWERWGDQTVGPGSNPDGWIKPKTKQDLVAAQRPAGRGDTYSGFNARYAADDPAERKHRNARSVWEIATAPYPDAHFATFPPELARRCIAAGCPEQVCGTCGKPRERLTDVTYEKSPVHGAGSVVGRHYETGSNNYDGAGMPRLNKRTETVGWSDCGHNNYAAGVVLDPFMGSGTTAHVARKLGRRAVGVELNPDYAALCAKRTEQQSLLAEEVA